MLSSCLTRTNKAKRNNPLRAFWLGTVGVFSSVVGVLLSSTVAEAAPVDLQFTGASCINNTSGTPVGTPTYCLTQGSIWRFPDAVVGAGPGTQRDVWVTISGFSNASLATIDDTVNGSFPRFQPSVIHNGLLSSTGYARFNIKFVAAGDLTGAAISLGGELYATAFDIDGDGNLGITGAREFVEFRTPISSAIASPTLLQTNTPAINAGGEGYIVQSSANNQAGIGDDDRYKATAVYGANTTNFDLVIGSKTGTLGCGRACQRLSSTSFFATDVIPIRDLVVTKTHTGNFAQGQTDATYSLTVSSFGAAPTTGQVTVVDTLPAGLTATAASGNGWSCTLNQPAAGQVQCTRSDALDSGSSYPPITLTVDVAANAPTNVTNTATVSGGGDFFTGNNTATDPTTINAFDYSDAPTSGTAPNGTDTNNYGDAIHLIVNTLKLGATIDSEVSSLASADADGDGDDDDGITLPTLTAGATSYKIPAASITATNTTGSPATLHAWVDFNKNGVFENNEYASTTVNTGTNDGNPTSDLDWSTITVGATGNTFARFRLTTDNSVTSTTPSVTANNGEVEDYSLTISSPGNSISGKIFDDVNYGGGPGRNYAAANSSATSSGWSDGAIGSGSTVVELYKDILGNFVKVAQTTANSNGDYNFTGQSNGTYRIRVLNRTVPSVRPIDPTPIDIIPVQTFRYDPDEATEENRSIINEVGGRKPSVTDPTTIIPLSTLLPPNAQSYTEVVINNNGITNADFGFNFDTIVNTNSSGQGSLRQFIINSNVLGNLRLDQDESANSVAAQVTKNAGIEHSIFMIPNALDPLNRPADTGYTSASGLDGGSGNTFEIKLDLGELTVTAEKTAIDGRTQTALTGDTNSSSVGTSTGPEVVISSDDNLSIDLLTIAAEDVLVDSIGLVKAKNILAGASALGRGLVIGGSNLIGITDPIIVRNSTISSNDTNGIQVNGFTSNAPSSIQIIDNVIRQNGQRSSLVSSIGSDYVGQFGNGIALLTNGLSLTNGSIKNIDILNNAISENRENGIKVLLAASPNIVVENLNIQNNTINNNGTGSSTAKDGISFEAVANASNVFLISSVIKNSQIIANEISRNQGDGISLTANVGIVNPIVNLVFDPISAVTISRNSIFENTDLGIDLEISPTITPQTGVTSNDDGDTDVGPNGLLNFPVFERAEIIAGNLVIEGWAPPESIIELFLADAGPSPNPLPSGYTTSFGEGQTYLLTLQEGGTNGISDTDATQSTYTNDGTGSTTTKTENRFQFTIPLSGGMLGGVPIANGTRLTATGTKNSSTSEFNGVTVVNPTPNDPNLLLVKRITRINGQTQNGSTNLDVYIDDDDYDYDDNTLAAPAPDPVDTENWPTPSDYLKGAINGGTTKPGDEIEYTIYFLSTGDKEAADVAICDRVPAFQTFVPDAFNSVSPAPNGGAGANRGILVEYDNTTLSYTNDANDDTAQYYPPGANLPTACDNLPPQTDERDDNGNPVDNGTVVVNLGDIPNADGPGTPDDSYGLIRFRTKVK